MIQIGKYKKSNIFTDTENTDKSNSFYDFMTSSTSGNYDGEKINLNNPIFVYYLCIKNMSTAKTHELIYRVENQFSKYKDITMWIVPTEESSKIECVFNGNNMLNKNRLDVFDRCETIEDFQREVRQWRLDNLNI